MPTLGVVDQSPIRRGGQALGVIHLYSTSPDHVLDPDDQLIGIGSGGPFALAAARALMAETQLDAEAIARRSLKIAADICIYTNDQITLETL